VALSRETDFRPAKFDSILEKEPLNTLARTPFLLGCFATFVNVASMGVFARVFEGPFSRIRSQI